MLCGSTINAELRDYVYMLFFGLSALYGSIAGYVSSRLFKFFNGTMWLTNFYLTATVVPLSVAFGLLLIDLFTWVEKVSLDHLYA